MSFDNFNKIIYPGRCILLGVDDRGNPLVIYFIMGRSENSRNRKFNFFHDGFETVPINADKVENPHLIIYRAMRSNDKMTLVTNGMHTEDYWSNITKEGCVNPFTRLYESMMKQLPEDDAPHFTPRIGGLIYGKNEGEISYCLNIVKKQNDSDNTHSSIRDDITRQLFCYEGIAGVGHYIHTYMDDSNPLISFLGEPVEVSLTGSIYEITENIWNNINEDNKIAIYGKIFSSNNDKQSIYISKNDGIVLNV